MAVTLATLYILQIYLHTVLRTHKYTPSVSPPLLLFANLPYLAFKSIIGINQSDWLLHPSTSGTYIRLQMLENLSLK